MIQTSSSTPLLANSRLSTCKVCVSPSLQVTCTRARFKFSRSDCLDDRLQVFCEGVFRSSCASIWQLVGTPVLFGYIKCSYFKPALYQVRNIPNNACVCNMLFCRIAPSFGTFQTNTDYFTKWLTTCPEVKLYTCGQKTRIYPDSLQGDWRFVLGETVWSSVPSKLEFSFIEIG